MAVKFVKKNVYEVRLFSSGRHIRRRFPDKWIARDFEENIVIRGMTPELAMIEAKGLMKKPELVVAKSLTFQQFAEDVWLPALASGAATQSEEPLTRGTLRRYRDRIKFCYPYFGFKRCRSLTVEDWNRFKAGCRTDPMANGKVLTPGSANAVLKRVKQCSKYAEEIGVIDRSPFTHAKNIRVAQVRKDFWRPDECERFLSHVATRDKDHFAYFAVALHTAMRKAEILGLKLKDLDFDSRTITVERQWDNDAYEHPIESGKRIATATKGNLKNGETYKVIPMSDTLYEILRERVKTMIGRETFLFDFGMKFKKHPGGVLKEYAAEAGLRPMKAHGTRDSAIGNLKIAGVSDWFIAKIAGCSIDNLRKYGHLDLRDVSEAIQVLNMRIEKK